MAVLSRLASTSRAPSRGRADSVFSSCQRVGSTAKWGRSRKKGFRAMAEHRGKRTLGAFLVALGVLFLLVNSGRLWFGWGAVWPLFPFLGGISMMKLYTGGRRPGALFGALVLTQLGLFFFVFTTGAVGWEAMATLWPFLILIPGIASLAVAMTGGHRVSALIVGLVATAVSVMGFWVALGEVGSGVFAPVVRLWPFALIVTGIMIWVRARRASTSPHARPVNADDDPS